MNMKTISAICFVSCVLVACGDKDKEVVTPKKTAPVAQTTSDPKVFVVGKWAGEPGWECSDPIVITPNSVSLGKGQKIPLVIDGDGSVVLEKDGPFLTPNFESNTLVYGGSESGDSFALSRCQ